MEYEIEPMREEHISGVIALEQDCNLSSRSEQNYLEVLHDKRWILLVVCESSKVIAICSAQMVVDELQIDNIAVAEGSRQKGIASALLLEALEIASQAGMLSMVLDVRASNFAALRLYERHGFAVVGRRKDYYQNPLDDALLMTLNIGKH